MKNKVLPILIGVILLMNVFSIPVLANEVIYTVSNFSEFKNAVEKMNNSLSDDIKTINLAGDINFGSSGYNCVFSKNVVIVGNGHTINLGNEQSNGELRIRKGATLSLGKSNGLSNENRLKITVNATLRSIALIHIGTLRETGILNIYDGVELTGCKTNGASFGSAVNITNGEFNMYGGDIHENTNEAAAETGGAVAGDGRLGKVVFNMYGGSIRDNKTFTNGSGYGGGVSLLLATFNMYGGSISGNTVEKTADQQGYGGGIALIYGSAVLYGGNISNNTSSGFGGGVFTYLVNSIVIKQGFSIKENSSSEGGGLCNYGGNATVEEGAIIANNRATSRGDDIAHYGNDLALATAKSMNTHLSTDNSNNLITGWYLDDPRWQAESAIEIDVTSPLGATSKFLKAAYESKYEVIYYFASNSDGKGLPDEVLNLLPVNTQEYNLGNTVIPIQPTQSKVAVAGGVWEFKGYGADSKIISAKKTEFLGMWIFKDNMTIVNKVPVIYADDKTINCGDFFNPLESVRAIDEEDGNLKNHIKILSNTVDTSREGVYQIIYKVSDSFGATVTKTIKVSVVKKAVVEKTISSTIYVKGSKKPVVIKSSGLYNNFTGLMVDGKLVETKNYKVEKESTVVTIEFPFLEELVVGNHTVTFLYNDGNVEGTLMVTEIPKEVISTGSPNTGDTTNTSMWIVVLLGSLGTLVFAIKKARKKK